MATIEMKDASGKKVKDAELSAAVFEIEPNVHVMHEVVRSQRAARRQGTHDTLTRGQVRGGGKKPWRPEGYRSCSSGYDPCSSMGGRRHRIRSSSSLLRFQGTCQGCKAGYALCAFR